MEMATEEYYLKRIDAGKAVLGYLEDLCKANAYFGIERMEYNSIVRRMMNHVCDEVNSHRIALAKLRGE